MPPTTQEPTAATPIAIIIGFALVAVAIYFGGYGKNDAPTVPAPVPQDQSTSIAPINQDDYIRGNPNAPIVIIEYSDYDCQYCKEFHTTMQQIMDEYGVTGKVAWVYRQMPIAQLHPNAPKISEAALCVGDLGGSQAFWTFSDLVFSERALNEPTNMTALPEFSTKAGVDATQFNTCLQSGRMSDRVRASVTEGFNAGITGTPHSVLLVGNQQALIEGAQPYLEVRQIIDNLIQQLEGTSTNVTP